MTNEERNLLSSDPYPGLRPYHEDEQDKFFGRDADAEVLLDKVLTNRLTLLFAASGVGKSSLLQAAVIPRLKSPTGENLEVVYHIDWVSEPVSSVRAAVLQALHSSGKLPEGAADEAGETLAELLEFCGLFVRHPLVLILDQFEEFFRYQRASANFQPFIEQLTAIITNPQLPVSLVLSMREDFALELNAFKPRLPTILFENFYRLEKLGRVGAREAIVTPVEQVGFRYEPVLLEILLDDLLSRELDRLPNSPAAELLETVEPPYLQIVCAQLWDLNRADPDKLLRLATYEKAGKAKGILSNYLKGVLQGFSLTEKQLASKAFDHLASQRGVKMAYTAAALAETVRESEAALGKVLDKLAAVRILRTQQRGEATWYELYHDMFSGSIESWNGEWKDRMRRRKFAQVAAASFVSIAALFAGWDYYVNASNYHLRLSPKQGISDRVELWQGKLGSFDLFHQQRYLAETDFERNQLEPDKQFNQKSVTDYNKLQMELIGNLPIESRVEVYSQNGNFNDALVLAEKAIVPEQLDLAKRALPKLEDMKIPSAAMLVYRLLAGDNINNQEIKKQIAGDDVVDRVTNYSIGVFLLHTNVSIRPDSPEVVQDFWRNQLHGQIITQVAREQLMKLKIKNEYSQSNEILTALGEFSDLNDVGVFFLKLLKHEEADVRVLAANVLMKWGYSKAVLPVALHILRDKDEVDSVRLSAANLILELQGIGAIPDLLELLDDQDDDFRSSVVDILGVLQDRTVVPALMNLLKDQSSNVRSSVATALAVLQGKEAIPSLTLLLKDQDAEVRLSAARGLINVQGRASFPILLELLQDRSADVRSQVLRELGDLQVKENIAPLIKSLKDKDEFVRSAAAITLGRLQYKEAVAELIELLKDTSNNARSSALISLEELQGKEAISTLLNTLKDSDGDVASVAVNILGELQGDEAIPVFLDLLKNPSFLARTSVIRELGELQSKESIIPFLRLLKDQDVSVRSLAAVELGRLQVKKTIPILSRILNDKYSSVQSDILEMQDKGYVPIEGHDDLLNSPFNSLRRLSFINHVALLRLERSDELNHVQKRLCQKVIAQLSQQDLADAREELEEEEVARVKPLPISQPAPEDKPLTLAELQAKLDGFDDAYADWRNRRDTTPESDSETANLDNPAPLIFEYAYSIAGVDEDEGIKLLGHNLQEVREAAANSLARSTFLGVPLLQRLEKEWLTTDNPITRQSLFHAIDLVLLALEKTKDKDLEALKAYEVALSDERSIASIKPRVEWTRVQLEWRLNALKELKDLAEKRMPSLLKDYCMNLDGTDIEGCTITR